MAARSVVNTRAGPVLRYTPSASTTDGSMAVLLMTEPSGARLPRGKVTVLVSPRSRACVGRHDHVVGIDAVALAQQLAQPARGARSSPTSRAPRPAARRSRSGSPGRAARARRRCSITSGTPPARKTRTVGWSDRPVGQHVDQPRHAAVDRDPVLDRRAAAARRRGRWPGCAAAGSSSRRTPRGRPSRCGSAASVRMSRVVRPRASQARPARAPSGGPCRARSAGPTGPAPRAAATGPSASPTTCDVAAVPRNWQPPPGEAHARQPSSAASSQRHLAVGEARADRLHLARRPRRRVGGSVTPPGTSTHGRSCMRGQRHHHRRQALVAGGHAEHARARRAASGSAGGTPCAASLRYGRLSIMPGRALGAAVARVGARSRRTGMPPQPRAAPRPPPASAARPPSGRCGSRARSACRRRRAMPPWVLRIRNCVPAQLAPGPSPCRRSGSARTGRRSGASRSISAVSGRLPAGPGPRRAHVVHARDPTPRSARSRARTPGRSSPWAHRVASLSTPRGRTATLSSIARRASSHAGRVRAHGRHDRAATAAGAAGRARGRCRRAGARGPRAWPRTGPRDRARRCRRPRARRAPRRRATRIPLRRAASSSSSRVIALPRRAASSIRPLLDEHGRLALHHPRRASDGRRARGPSSRSRRAAPWRRSCRRPASGPRR